MIGGCKRLEFIAKSSVSHSAYKVFDKLPRCQFQSV